MKGWTYTSEHSNAKMHYLNSDDRSLCGAWMVLNPDPKRFFQNPAMSLRCRACSKKLAVEVARSIAGVAI